MIEIGEAYVLARQMEDALTGKRVASASFLEAPHKFCWVDDPVSAVSLLSGNTVFGAEQRGGRVILRFADGLLLAIGEDVSVRFEDPRREKTQMLLTFTDGSVLTARVRLYGFLSVGTEAQLRENPYHAANFDRPHPLHPAFTREHFYNLAGENCGLTLKGLLATKQNIPGVGNGTLHDILFLAGLRPMTKVSVLREEQLSALFDALVATVRAVAAAGGRSSFTDLFGNKGMYRELTGRTDGYCPVCGSAITVKTYMGGKVRFCPTCQKDAA
ncbi:MAG: hypothetical protein Q8N15_00165 [Bacillota bacterium]|nr:hypothetical protein [Bacillota bacterium]